MKRFEKRGKEGSNEALRMEKTLSAVISWDKRKRECGLEKDKVCLLFSGTTANLL